jgi:hypothetical protein
MSDSAHITSTDAVREFRVALQQYEAEIRDAIDQLLLERQRSLDWVEQDRARYWPAEVRRASDAVIQARQDLERCEMAIRAQDRRSCYEQRVALEKARQRQRLAEQKVRAVRRWRVSVQQEADSLHGRLLKLTDFLDTEFPRAIAALGRMATALDKYTDRRQPRDSTPDHGLSEASDVDGGQAAASDDGRQETQP